MRNQLLLPFCFIATLGIATAGEDPAPAAKPAAGPPPLVFSAVGCGPYVPADSAAAKFYIARENEVASSRFLVHLGDINSGADAKAGKLDEAHYARIKALLTEGNTIPTYIVPGDNEWNDRPDPDVGWAQWSKHLLGLEKNFEVPWETSRQEGRPENFAFIADGVLVIGINLPGGRVHDHAEWMTRFRENNDWIEKQFAQHKDDASAAVVCAQANIVGQGRVKLAVKALFTPFGKRFAKLAKDFGKPVLFLHADGHKWTYDNPWKEAPNVTRIQVDRLDPNFPPVQLTVDPDAEKPFGFDRRLKDPEWKAPK